MLRPALKGALIRHFVTCAARRRLSASTRKMAIYHLSAKLISRSSGRSATAAAAYRAGEKITDERTGEVHDYSRKRGVDHTEIIAPAQAPEALLNRSKLWNEAEASEKRKDAQIAREIEIALPRELTPPQQIALVQRYVRSEFVSAGMIADIAIHHARGENPHAHILLTMRDVGSAGFGPKNRSWNDRALLETWRERWSDHCNTELEKAGHEARIDHRSLVDQGVERAPQQHLGPALAEMQRRGVVSDVEMRRQQQAQQQQRRQAAAAAAAAAARAQIDDVEYVLDAHTAAQRSDKKATAAAAAAETAAAAARGLLARIGIGGGDKRVAAEAAAAAADQAQRFAAQDWSHADISHKVLVAKYDAPAPARPQQAQEAARRAAEAQAKAEADRVAEARARVIAEHRAARERDYQAQQQQARAAAATAAAAAGRRGVSVIDKMITQPQDSSSSRAGVAQDAQEYDDSDRPRG